MQLTQFGSIMTYAISMEENLAEFYEKASKETGSNTAELLSRMKACKKRIKRLERSRRENVTEIKLEPIEGLNPENYQLDLTSFSPQAINTIEQRATGFYGDVAPKINVRESRRVLERCQKEHSDLKKIGE